MSQYGFLIVALISAILLEIVHCSPTQHERRYNLNATSILGAIANTQSEATATGPDSFVEISGIVSGEVASSSGVESLSAEPATSSIASQVNCSEYSTSSASGGSSADALASGDCAMNINDSGAHSLKAKEVGGKGNIQVEGQVNSHPDSSQETAQITQATMQVPLEGSAEAYQMVSGPQAISSFSGTMAQAQTDVVSGTQETLLTHAAGDTNIQTLVIPFGIKGEVMAKSE